MKMAFIGQKVVFCGTQKFMMLSDISSDFFIKGLRLVRPSIAESFSSAAEGHRNGGRFPVELPSIGQFINSSFV